MLWQQSQEQPSTLVPSGQSSPLSQAYKLGVWVSSGQLDDLLTTMEIRLVRYIIAQETMFCSGPLPLAPAPGPLPPPSPAGPRTPPTLL